MPKITQSIRIIILSFMLTFAGLFFLATLAGCAENEKRVITLEDTDTNTFCTASGDTITCPDGSELLIVPEINKRVVNVPANTCSSIGDGLYVENIRNALIYDVYTNDKCEDRLGELCDNVSPSFGSSGSFGTNGTGSATVCSAQELLIFAHKNADSSLDVTILDID